MGAAGYVIVYDEAAVRSGYAELFPDNNIDDDWWYLKTITATLDGKRWIFDYGDDQGHHAGSDNDFWFGRFQDDERVIPAQEAQQRVLKALRRVALQGGCQRVEVWT